jgi:hypothetical protein
MDINTTPSTLFQSTVFNGARDYSNHQKIALAQFTFLAIPGREEALENSRF